MKTTLEYFNKSLDELLETNGNNETLEERLLKKQSEDVVFFEDTEEMNQEQESFSNWLTAYNLNVETELITINERIAVVLQHEG